MTTNPEVVDRGVEYEKRDERDGTGEIQLFLLFLREVVRSEFTGFEYRRYPAKTQNC